MVPVFWRAEEGVHRKAGEAVHWGEAEGVYRKLAEENL